MTNDRVTLVSVTRPCSGPVQSHSWSADRSMVALARGGQETVSVVRRSGDHVGAAVVASLAQHDLTVTSLDWAPASGMIVTCSQDRNAYVWVPDGEGGWRHTLVLLRINRAATCVR